VVLKSYYEKRHWDTHLVLQSNSLPHEIKLPVDILMLLTERAKLLIVRMIAYYSTFQIKNSANLMQTRLCIFRRT
jgi:hypothetical protein